MGIFIKSNCDCCPPSVCEPCDPCAATQGTGTLYFTGAVTSAWDYVGNWWQDAAATIPALAAPWLLDLNNPGCIPYYHYNLTVATGYLYGPTNTNARIVAGDGICDMYGVINKYIIDSGTFTGEQFINDGNRINGGTFTGDHFGNFSDIYGGTFSGNDFLNDGGLTFDGIHFIGQGRIYGGTWAGSGFRNHSQDSDYDGYVCAPSWPVQTC